MEIGSLFSAFLLFNVVVFPIIMIFDDVNIWSPRTKYILQCLLPILIVFLIWFLYHYGDVKI